MKKDECESKIRYLCGVYAKEFEVPMDGSGEPRFSDFLTWLEMTYPQYLNFRARGGVLFNVERWWASEFRQNWRY